MRSTERANLMSLLAVFVLVYPVILHADHHGWSPLAKMVLGFAGLAVLVGVKFALLDMDEWRAERAARRRARAARRRDRAARRVRTRR